MNLDIQKASMLKRISAWLLDFILLLIIIVGVSALISHITHFDDYNADIEAHYDEYETQYGVSFGITQDVYDAMTDAERENYDAAYDALVADEEFMYSYNMMVSLTLMNMSLSILIGYLIAEFVIPIILKNGMTVGKKVFGIAVIRRNCVKMNNVSLFIRTVLGKYTLETMIPVLIGMMLIFGMTGIFGTLVVLALLVAEIIILAVTKNNSTIHDLLADTVAVDMASQQIFDTEEDLIAYKKRMSAENAEQSSYF